MDRVDGGVVYRAELEEDYNVSTLEPVIVGPDFSDGPDAANDALRNIDNVYAEVPKLATQCGGSTYSALE